MGVNMPHPITTPEQHAERIGACIGSTLLADLMHADGREHAAAILASALLHLLELPRPDHVAVGFASVLMPVVEEGMGLGLAMPVGGA